MTIDIERTKNQARAILDSRIKTVEELVKARQKVTDLKEQLATAERDDKRAYVKATRDGWSPDELKKLGLEPAAVSRRRKTQNKPQNTTDNQTPAPTPEHENANSN